MSKKKFNKVKEKRNTKEKGGLFSSLLGLLNSMEGKAYSAQQIAKNCK